MYLPFSDQLTRKVGSGERKDFAALNDPDAISGSAYAPDCLALYAAAAFVLARSLARSSLRSVLQRNENDFFSPSFKIQTDVKFF